MKIIEHSFAFENFMKLQKMMECQYLKLGVCEECKDRFICHTIRVKKFKVRSTLKDYLIFAENEIMALDFARSYLCSTGIIINVFDNKEAIK